MQKWGDAEVRRCRVRKGGGEDLWRRWEDMEVRICALLCQELRSRESFQIEIALSPRNLGKTAQPRSLIQPRFLFS